ncbi:MAG: hypothetical protein O3C21_08600 [Verrucomicrobia bacterium]|nr:hypothetical protein [Verrucomicrobiota bacterium]
MSIGIFVTVSNGPSPAKNVIEEIAALRAPWVPAVTESDAGAALANSDVSVAAKTVRAGPRPNA